MTHFKGEKKLKSNSPPGHPRGIRLGPSPRRCCRRDATHHTEASQPQRRVSRGSCGACPFHPPRQTWGYLRPPTPTFAKINTIKKPSSDSYPRLIFIGFYDFISREMCLIISFHGTRGNLIPDVLRCFSFLLHSATCLRREDAMTLRCVQRGFYSD